MFEVQDFPNVYGFGTDIPCLNSTRKEEKLAAPKKSVGVIISTETLDDALAWTRFLADRSYAAHRFVLDDQALVKEVVASKNGRDHVITKELRSDMEG